MEQVCNRCNRTLPLTERYFYKNKGMKTGFLKQCKECRGYSFELKETLPIGKLRCARCKKILPATSDHFHKGKDTKEGFKSACITCRSEKAKKYRNKYRDEIIDRERQDRINNPKKYAVYSKKYYNKIKDTEEYKSKQKKWWESYYNRHQDKLVKKQRERYKNDPKKYIKITKEYQSTPKGQLSVKRNNHKRRERERNSLNWFTEKDWIRCIEHFNNECCYCGAVVDKPTMEHFIPLSKGGEFSPKNILPACLSCNSSKHVNSFEEWYPRQDFHSVKRENKILNYLGYKYNKQQMALF